MRESIFFSSIRSFFVSFFAIIGIFVDFILAILIMSTSVSGSFNTTILSEGSIYSRLNLNFHFLSLSKVKI